MPGIPKYMPPESGAGSTADIAERETSPMTETPERRFEALAAEAEALRQSEARFRSLTAASFEGICLSHRGVVLDGNEQFMEMFGYTRAEMMGREILTLVAPQDREIIARRIRENAEDCIEHCMVRKDGSEFEGEARSKMLMWAGRPLRVTAVRDITARKEVERALRESEERYRTLVENAPETVAVAVDEKLVYVNPAAVTMFGGEGIGREYFIGRSVYEFMVEEYRDMARERRMAVLGGAPVGAWECLARRTDGTTFLGEARAIRFSYGGKVAILSLVRDVTPRKKAEEERDEARKREQEALEEYTRQLIASQEAERRRIAGELHDSLGQTLLLIKNRIDQLLKSPPAGEAQEHLQAAAELATGAIAEVRNISRDLRPYQLDQIGLTRSLRAMIDSAAESTGIVFKARIEEVDDVFANEAATNFYRIVQECVNNVLKHAGAKRVEVEVERDVREARFRIKDDGKGFTPGARPGGMGLRNVAERVRMLGGTTLTRSAPGKERRLWCRYRLTAKLRARWESDA